MTKPQAEKKKTKKAAKAAVKKHTGAKKEAASKPKGGRAAGRAARQKDGQASYSTSTTKGKSRTGRTDPSAAKKRSAHRGVDGDTGPPEQQRRFEYRTGFRMQTQQRHASTSGGGSIDYCALPDTLKARFTPDEYATLVEKQPEWETSLAGLGKQTIVSMLVEAGLPPLRTPDMANAMLDFMADPATEVSRQLPLLRDFKQPSSIPRVHAKHTGKRYGRRQFDEEVIFASDTLLDHKVLSKQDTVALVLTAASGTGKTFSVLSFPPVAQSSEHPDAKFLLAYIGFNIDWPIESGSTEEKLLVNTQDHVAAQDAVSNVVLARLLGVLQQMINHHDKLEGTPGFSSPVVDFAAPSGFTTEALHQVVVGKALQLQSEGFPNNRLVVVVNLDEAQALDELCGCYDRYGPRGARFALRKLRELQEDVYNASNGKCLLLTIATGINPNTTLSSNNDGWNKSIDVTLLTLDEFTALAEEHYVGVDDVKLSSVKQFAAAAYPRVREMMGAGVVCPIPAVGLTPVLAAKVLFHSFTGRRMPKSEIPCAIHAIGSQENAKPVLDVAVWPSMQTALQLRCLPFTLPMDFQRGCNKKGQSFAFERCAFRVTGSILELLHNAIDPYVMELSDRWLIEFKGAFERKNRALVRAWGRISSGESRFAIIGDEMQHGHPFETCHEAAAVGRLSKWFVEFLFIRHHHHLLVWTGGQAPFDFMTVWVQDQDTKSKRLAIAVGGAKHTPNPEDAASKKEVERRAKALAEDAVPWIEGMKRQLTDRGFIVEPSCPVSLITNVPMPVYETSDLHHQFTDQGGVARTVDVIVMSPSNLHFPPWTDVLFRCENQ